MKSTYYFFIALVIIFFLSCDHHSDKRIKIDLNKDIPQLHYSDFADSVSYLTLNMPDSLFLTGVKRLYIDDNYIFIQDKRAGLLVYSIENDSLVKYLNYFGQGPGEFLSIRAFTINPTKREILIYSYPFLHKYTYEGLFIETIKNENTQLVDLYCTSAGNFICIAPEYTGKGMPYGVWLADSTLAFQKELKKIPDEQRLYTRSNFYNRTRDGIYYYDRVWDDFSFITDDSVSILYKFDFKQRVPAKMRLQEQPSEELKEYYSINEFVYSNRYILLNYFSFGGSDISWVLLDHANNNQICSKQLLNDISGMTISSNNLFYIDNQTWCRILDFEEDKTTIILEMIHIRS